MKCIYSIFSQFTYKMIYPSLMHFIFMCVNNENLFHTLTVLNTLLAIFSYFMKII